MVAAEGCDGGAAMAGRQPNGILGLSEPRTDGATIAGDGGCERRTLELGSADGIECDKLARLASLRGTGDDSQRAMVQC